MKIESSKIAERFRQISDEEFTAIDKNTLTDEAQAIYDAEFNRRNTSDYKNAREAENKIWEEKLRSDGFQAPFRSITTLAAQGIIAGTCEIPKPIARPRKPVGKPQPVWFYPFP